MAPLANWIEPSGMASLGLIGRSMMAPVMATIVSIATTNNEDSDRKSGLVVWQVAAVSVFHALSAHSLATGLTTQTTGAVDREEQGALLGLEHSLFSLARIAGPSKGIMLLSENETNGFLLVATCCASMDLILVTFLWFVKGRTKRSVTKIEEKIK